MDTQAGKEIQAKGSQQTSAEHVEARTGDSSGIGKIGRNRKVHAVIRSAEFSPCLRYRYALIRRWTESESPMLGIIGKNPSVADGERDDPTIAKEMLLGKQLGFAGFVKLNLYDLVATDSDELIHVTESVACSEANRIDNIIERLKRHGIETVLCCWGTHSNRSLAERIRNRGEALRSRLRREGFQLLCLKKNGDGSPMHPLYVSLQVKPIPY